MNALTPMKNRRGSNRPAAGGSTTSWLLATALPVCLGLIPLQAEAVLDEVGGNGTIVNQVVNTDAAWITLRSVLVFSPTTNARRCIATGSSDAFNPGINPGGFGANLYRFRVSLNGLPVGVDGPFERTLQFLNQTVPIVRDNTIKEITSTGGVFVPPAGFSTIRWEARKFVGALNLTVDDSSLTVVCTDTELP